MITLCLPEIDLMLHEVKTGIAILSNSKPFKLIDSLSEEISGIPCISLVRMAVALQKDFPSV